MATKVKMLKLLQEIQGYAQITNRRPHQKSPGLFLVQARSSSNGRSRRRLTIPVDMQDPPDIPTRVRITHLTLGSEPQLADLRLKSPLRRLTLSPDSPTSQADGTVA